MVARIATGEIECDNSAEAKPSRATGKAGGVARSRSLTPEQRADIARVAAEARWKKD